MRLIPVMLNGKPVTIGCAHWRNFPPQLAKLGRTAEQLRAQKMVTESQYHQYKTWESVCGIEAMEREKCLECPHVRTAEFRDHLPVLVTLDGDFVTPTIDLPTLETNRQLREILGRVRPKPGGGKDG